jgi:hypothetical protein
MQRKELNCAIIEVANNRDMSGRATADRTNRGLRTGNGRKLWRIACSNFLGSLMVAGLFIALAPMPGRADDDKGIRAEIAALQAQVDSLQSTVSALESQVSTLQTGNTTLQNEIKSLKTSNTTLQTQLAAVRSNKALALGPFVSVDPNPEAGVVGPHITFTGANIHIVSGSGMTNDNGNPRGLGNLIIGYDEPPDSTEGGPPLNSGDRGGSHNLVIGPFNRFTQAAFGGLVAGELNTIQSLGASVSGGANNTASGFWASVSGGLGNTASGSLASVSGQGNTASGFEATVSGGLGNTASGFGASVSGGRFNVASGEATSVTGGTGNAAGKLATVVIGGQNVTDNKDNSIAPQPPFP